MNSHLVSGVPSSVDHWMKIENAVSSATHFDTEIPTGCTLRELFTTRLLANARCSPC